MPNADHPIPYPRRRAVRGILRGTMTMLFATLTRMEVHGRENLPQQGPLLVVVNHFSFLDSAIVVRVTPWPLEVLGGVRMPHAPGWAIRILNLWGSLSVHRGTGARGALRAAEAVLAQDGVVGMAPEGGAWATVLRPPRPGAAFLAVRSGARILPIGIDGAHNALATLKKGQRPRITVRIGQPFGPLHAGARGHQRRKQLDALGDQIMTHIAALIPPERRGFYSDDPAIRAAARGTADYPWSREPE